MNAQKTGFVYIWFDKKYNRYYIGCHWGYENDGYICSSSWMKKAYKLRPYDFKKRYLKKNITDRTEMFIEEQRWLDLIKITEIKPINPNPRYYNLNIKNNSIWHKYEEHIKTVGEKISAAKKGKSTGPRDPSVGQAISEAKKKSFEKRQQELGYKFSEEHRQNMGNALSGRKHTEEWKANNSKRMKERWSDGSRKRAEPRQTMSREEQDKLCSQQLKNRWADPEWAAKQRQHLAEGAKKRPPRSEESKQKARLAQLGKPKPRKEVLKQLEA
jgi:hypothetical protein